jgi:erythromycin esterase-like protein
MKLWWTIVVLLLAVSPAAAQPLAPDFAVDAARRPPANRPIRPGIWRLQGIDPALGTADLEPLRLLIGDASVVGLGESFHTSGGFYVMKHRVFRFLVEQMGFRAFAMESGWTGAELAARYVQTCEGTPEEAIRQHINVWQGREYADLIQWMCEWNRHHPGDEITFFGFDIQEPWHDGRGLANFLQRIDIVVPHPWVTGIESCEAVTPPWHPFGQIPLERHERCIRTLAEIEAHFQTHREDIQRRTSEQDLAMATLRLVGLRAWESSVFLIAHDFPAGYSARDEGMAYAFLTLKAQRAPHARTVIWAANSHVARTPLPDGSRPMGSLLADALGRDYVSFALTAYETEIDFPGFGCGPVTRRPESVEERLHGLREKALLVDLAFPGTRKPYLPRRPYNMGIDRVEPHRSYTGLIYLERSAKMHPFVWEPCG